MIRICLFVIMSAGLVTACGRSGRDDLRNGAALYAENCAVCHGADAMGGGGGGVFGLSKTPPDLTRLRLSNGGMFPLEDTVATLTGYAKGGLRGRQMSGFSALQSERKKRVRIDGARLRTTQPLANLLVYLESVQRR